MNVVKTRFSLYCPLLLPRICRPFLVEWLLPARSVFFDTPAWGRGLPIHPTSELKQKSPRGLVRRAGVVVVVVVVVIFNMPVHSYLFSFLISLSVSPGFVPAKFSICIWMGLDWESFASFFLRALFCELVEFGIWQRNTRILLLLHLTSYYNYPGFSLVAIVAPGFSLYVGVGD